MWRRTAAAEAALGERRVRSWAAVPTQRRTVRTEQRQTTHEQRPRAREAGGDGAAVRVSHEVDGATHCDREVGARLYVLREAGAPVERWLRGVVTQVGWGIGRASGGMRRRTRSQRLRRPGVTPKCTQTVVAMVMTAARACGRRRRSSG